MLYKNHLENIWQGLQGKNVPYKYRRLLDSTIRTMVIKIKIVKLTKRIVRKLTIEIIAYIDISDDDTITICI